MRNAPAAIRPATAPADISRPSLNALSTGWDRAVSYGLARLRRRQTLPVRVDAWRLPRAGRAGTQHAAQLRGALSRAGFAVRRLVIRAPGQDVRCVLLLGHAAGKVVRVAVALARAELGGPGVVRVA